MMAWVVWREWGCVGGGEYVMWSVRVGRHRAGMCGLVDKEKFGVVTSGQLLGQGDVGVFQWAWDNVGGDGGEKFSGEVGVVVYCVRRSREVSGVGLAELLDEVVLVQFGEE